MKKWAGKWVGREKYEEGTGRGSTIRKGTGSRQNSSSGLREGVSPHQVSALLLTHLDDVDKAEALGRRDHHGGRDVEDLGQGQLHVARAWRHVQDLRSRGGGQNKAD